MVNYSQGKIYKVMDNVGGADGDVYVGSTTKGYLSQRMDQHRSDYKRWKEGKRGNVTVFDIFEKYGIDNCCIVLLETVSATSIDELHARERFWVQSTACVNKCIPGRSRADYNIVNREQISQHMSRYNIIHREQILAQKSERAQCECGCIVTRGGLSQHRKTQKHKEAITEASHL